MVLQTGLESASHDGLALAIPGRGSEPPNIDDNLGSIGFLASFLIIPGTRRSTSLGIESRSFFGHVLRAGTVILLSLSAVPGVRLAQVMAHHNGIQHADHKKQGRTANNLTSGEMLA
jgi:hypothetical protein